MGRGQVFFNFSKTYVRCGSNGTRTRINASAPAPSFPLSEAAAADRLSSRTGWGCCPIHKKKRRIFLTVTGSRNYAALSGLSDERSRRKSLREEFRPRWQNSGSPGQLEIPRF